jgi:hypothetical protein
VTNTNGNSQKYELVMSGRCAEGWDPRAGQVRLCGIGTHALIAKHCALACMYHPRLMHMCTCRMLSGLGAGLTAGSGGAPHATNVLMQHMQRRLMLIAKHAQSAAPLGGTLT